MFKILTKIYKVYSNFELYDDFLIVNIGDGKQSNITIYNQNYDQNNKLSETAYDFFVGQNKIVFTTQVIITDQKIMKSFSYDLNSNFLRELPYTLYLRGMKKQDKYFCIGNQGYASPSKPKFFFIVDLNTLDIVEKINYPLGLRGIDIFIRNGIISSNKLNAKIGFFDLNNIAQWQHDLSALAAFTNYEGKVTKGEIRNIYEYNDSVIVITQLYIFRVDIIRGDMIYSKKLPAGLLSLSLFQNRAFGCYGHHYLEIDLDSGEVINFNRIEHEEYEGEKYLAYMNEAYYDDELIYHGIRLSNGVHGVGIIDVKSASRLFFHPTGVHNIEQIKVHREKLFVRDTENLHVFDKTTA